MGGSRSRVGVVVTLALMAALTGCGASGGRDDGAVEGAESSSTSAPAETRQPPSLSPTPTPSREAADGTDVGACFDGSCEIAVSKPTRVKVDSRFRVPNLRVTKITADTVVVESSGPGTFLRTSLAEGGTGIQNGIGFRLKSLENGTAVLEFFAD
ncbi:hypothetical protein SLINC_2821 [Streptomyces lincolnensis]|uniref:Uncharacterized protein n=1 Tax=Streptomyces lincolnensis TaxID=1915 RepID=A0A1B1M8T5_STRLN|nr:hypothetical protein [Streptomyces lincolnensis]ANS65045.1 hypothetical protein SLINC_2821 [Streptomyces lincolnensis]AXG56746.1 hypothetical protein SLCG_5591 [Streptomyces lincolnensis]QMV06836.1 hypothetical protein GJU35_14865 [Streptomyces lincolnensis]